MDLPVGDHDGAGDARGRHVAEARCPARENRRVSARSSAASARPASTTRTSNCLKRASRSCRPASAALRFGLAVADVLALAAVDDQRHDALQRLALLVEQHRVEQGRGKGCKRCKAEDRAALAKPQADQRQDAEAARARPQAAARTGAVRRRSTSSCVTAPAVRAAPAHAPGRICSCRSACTS